ncbi:hypothetical protein [Rhizobium sp. BK418]|uniref:hypothetical protein n=1 Tax=Rhizobium sp. BK418 TaxID=2512120 RepID=UPI0010431093|nr:hypothetical protein [Rhizobium sp. BK418]TCR97833.1 conjugative transfer protein TrbH [Rhizobium sp. BK418]
MRRSLLALACCMALDGCQAPIEDGRLAIEPVQVSPDVAAVIAGDMAVRLSERLSPASSLIRLSDEASEFSPALRASLKASGYTVVSDSAPKAKAIVLSYGLTQSPDGLLASLSTDGMRLARIYAVSGARVTPIGPLSVATF